MRVVVTDGEHRAALAVVRSLGAAGHDVTVTATRVPALATVSRHAARARVVPSPLADPVGYARALASLVRELGIEVVEPVTDESCLALSPVRASLAPAVVPLPPDDVVWRTADKAEVARVARTVGIAVPEQWTLPAAEGLPDGLDFPLVLKTSRSVIVDGASRTKSSVRYAADGAEARAVLAAFDPGAFPVLVQRRVVGPGAGTFFLRWNGGTRACFAHQRVREKPPSGGVSVCSESVALPDDLRGAGERLLDALGWSQGVAMIEYKRDRASGVPYLMEINGRFWGSLQLAIDCGVDFPALLIDAVAGRATAGPSAWPAGRQCRWWWGEVDHLITRLRRSDAALSLPPGSAPVSEALRAMLPSAAPGRRRNEVLRWDDPRPALRETIDWFRRR